MNHQHQWLVGQRVRAELTPGDPVKIEGTIVTVRRGRDATDVIWLVVEDDAGETFDVRSDWVVSI